MYQIILGEHYVKIRTLISPDEHALIKRITKRFSRLFRHAKEESSTIIDRSKHTISRKHLSQSAIKTLYRLKDAGFAAYLVGGGVRDLLLGKQPKDFDVVTNAHPEEIRRLFRNSRIIGRRFRLVHVYYDGNIIEVSTFRAALSEQTYTDNETEIKTDTGMLHRDNTYGGTIEEDAWRRDFTVNALYYNIADFSVVDYMQGMTDLKHRVLRMIGDPAQRYHEDPVRLLRAIRLAAKLDFTLASETETALKQLPHLLKHVPTARLFDESLKLFFAGYSVKTYQLMKHYDYTTALFPQTMKALANSKDTTNEQLIQIALRATDKRIQAEESINHGFLLSVLLWPVLREKMDYQKKQPNKRDKFYMKLHQWIHDILKTQLETLMLPRRLQFVMQAIWVLQFQLERRRPSRVLAILQHRYFRAAYDFMELRVQAGEINTDCFDWWTTFQIASPDTQKKMIEQLN